MRKEEGWIYFDRNGYLLKESRRKRRGVEISFTFSDNGESAATSVSSAKQSYNASGSMKKSSPMKKSPPRASALKNSMRTQQNTVSSTVTKITTKSSSSNVRSAQRKHAPRKEFKPREIDTEDQRKIDQDLNRICGEMDEQNKAHINHLDKNVDGLKEVSRQIGSTLDEIEHTRQRDINNVRSNTLEILDNLVYKSEGLSQLQDAQARLTEKQNDFFEKEHQLNSLRHGNSLLTAILAKATDLNGERDHTYEKFNELLTKDLENQKTEVMKILKETEDESKEVYKSSKIDRTLSDIGHAIKTTAVDEIRKRESLQDKYQRELNRAKDQKDDILGKIKNSDSGIKGLKDHIGKQKKDIDDKEKKLAEVRDKIVKERQGLVQDEIKNSELEKRLQEMKNRLRFYEQEKLYLLTEKSIASTKINIDEQLLGERDKAMNDWMKGRINDEQDKKTQLENKMNQCYSFETKEIIDLFKKEKKLQAEQRQEFIDSLKDELNQKLENEKNIKSNVESAKGELAKMRKTVKKGPMIQEDINIDQEKIYGDLKEVTLDNLDKNQSLATSKKDVKELEVKIMLIENELEEYRSQFEELEGSFKQPMKEYAALQIDESELERLRREYEKKQQELRKLEDEKAQWNQKISMAEKEYRTIKIHRSEVYIIREEGAEGDYEGEGEDEEQKVEGGYGNFQTSSSNFQKSSSNFLGGSNNFHKSSSYQKTSSSYQVNSSQQFMSPPKTGMSASELRQSRLSRSPGITRDVENVMKEVYYGRPGPKIRKTEDGTFIYGTREFIVTKERNKLLARDLDQDAKDNMALEDYLRKHEINERETALRTNLQYLNDDIGSEDDEMAEVGEEFDNKSDDRFGVR